MRLQQHHFNSQSATAIAAATTASSSAVAAPSSTTTTPSSSSVEVVESSTNSSLNDSCLSNGGSNGVVIGVHPNSNDNDCDSGSLFLVSSRSKRKSQNNSDSHAHLGRNQSNQSQQRQRFSMHNMSAAVNTLQRLQQSSGLGTPIRQHQQQQQRTTMYRLSSFNADESPQHHGEPPLVTPTYESIDVQNLVNNTTSSATNAPTAAGVHGYHHTMEHQTSNAYAESSQGTSDGPEGSTGCMSDNPAVTIPDNHRLYPSHGAHHYYAARTGSIMPMSGMMVPNGMMSHPHHHPYPYPAGGYLTRSLHYYHPDSGFYFGGSGGGCSPTRTSPPLYHSGSSAGAMAAAAASARVPAPRIKDEDFDIFNAIFALISLMSHVCCSGSTFILAYFLWRHEQDYTLFWLTIMATLLPSIVVNAISLKWLLNDNHRQNIINNNNNNNGNGNGNSSSSSSSSPITNNHNGTILIRRPEIGPCGWMLRILLHIVLLGPVLRYIDLLRYGVKSWSDKRRRVDQQQKDIGSWSSSTALPSLSTTLPRPRFANSSTASGLPNFEPATVKPKKNVDDRMIDYYLLTVAEDRDTSLLSLFNCLMQCTIQMILHTHSLLCHWYFEHHHHLSDYNHNYTEYVQIAVIGISLFEASWSISSYHRALRRASYDKRNLSSMATIIQSLWHALTLSSRILAISLFLHQFGYWLLPVAIGHWGVMTIWIMHQGTHFFDSDLGHPNPCREYLFNMLIGLIYMFVFINLKDQPTRYKYLAFYLVTFLENLTFSSLWFVRIEDYWWPLRFPLFISVPILFAASIIMMQFYYWLVHPNGRPLFINKAARCC